MTKKWQDLIGEMSKKRQARIRSGADRILQEITLRELRRARELTQQDVAASLNVNQAAISKMEGQADMRISTLRKLLNTMGGTLKLVAEFPDGEVVIDGIDHDGQQQELLLLRPLPQNFKITCVMPCTPSLAPAHFFQHACLLKRSDRPGHRGAGRFKKLHRPGYGHHRVLR